LTFCRVVAGSNWVTRAVVVGSVEGHVGQVAQRVVPRRGAQQVADLEPPVERGDEAVAADESARRARLGVVLHHQEVGAGPVTTEDGRRELRSDRCVLRFTVCLRELRVHFVDGVAHG